MIDLFQLGDFTLRSGAKSRWKIECDAITEGEWKALAVMAREVLEPFGSIWGVPRGGIPFAEALADFMTPGAPPLVCEDVVTTGGSILRFMDAEGLHVPGVQAIAVFGRGEYPSWIKTLFRMER